MIVYLDASALVKRYVAVFIRKHALAYTDSTCPFVEFILRRDKPSET